MGLRLRLGARCIVAIMQRTMPERLWTIGYKSERVRAWELESVSCLPAALKSKITWRPWLNR
jgi:hypothetical protein